MIRVMRCQSVFGVFGITMSTGKHVERLQENTKLVRNPYQVVNCALASGEIPCNLLHILKVQLESGLHRGDLILCYPMHESQRSHRRQIKVTLPFDRPTVRRHMTGVKIRGALVADRGNCTPLASAQCLCCSNPQPVIGPKPSGMTSTEPRTERRL